MNKTNAFIVHNGTKLYECPDCGGHGEVMMARLYPSGHTECWIRASSAKALAFLLKMII